MPASREVALVTGASSGLGNRFAHLLAQRGWDLIVTGRRIDLLEELRRKIEQDYAVSVQVISHDLSEANSAKQLFDRIQESGDQVHVLVNNAGVGHYGQSLDQPLQSIAGMVNVNVVATTELTRLFGERMKATGGGYILQNASFSGFVALPRYSIYAATKAYIVSLGLAMRYELRKSGVSITVLCPGFAATDFFDAAGHKMTGLMRLICMDPQMIAEAGIDGLFRKRSLIVPGTIYKFCALLLRVLPRYTATAFAAAIVKDRAGRA